MYQGSIAKLKSRNTGEEDWYQKLRYVDKIYFVNIYNTDIKIEQNKVDETLCGNQGKEYRVVFEILGEDVVRCGNYKIDESIIIASQQAQAIQKSLQDLKEQKRINNVYLRTYEKYKNQDIDINNEIVNLENALVSISKGKPIEYTYVHGKYTADSKEDCWILPFKATIFIGDTIEVDTSVGSRMIIVTKVEKSFEYKNRRNVIRAT